MKKSKKVLAILIMFLLCMSVFALAPSFESRAEEGETSAFSAEGASEDENVELVEGYRDSGNSTSSEGSTFMQIYRTRFFILWIIGVLLLALIAYVLISGNRRRSRAFREQPQPEISTVEEEVEGSALTNKIVLTDMSRPDTRYSIEVGTTTILGRSKARCDIAFPEYPSMSSRQARIFFEDGKVYLENLDTVETTILNGTVVKGIEEISNGALIQLGDLALKVRYV